MSLAPQLLDTTSGRVGETTSNCQYCSRVRTVMIGHALCSAFHNAVPYQCQNISKQLVSVVNSLFRRPASGQKAIQFETSEFYQC
jgi:hypothetical protein